MGNLTLSWECIHCQTVPDSSFVHGIRLPEYSGSQNRCSPSTTCRDWTVRAFFELHLPDVDSLFSYTFHSIYSSGERSWKDPYCLTPSVTNEALIPFNEGWDRRPFSKLGAIPRINEGVEGVSFVIWAPSARSVHLVGDFNRNPQSHLCGRLDLPVAVNFLFPSLKSVTNTSFKSLERMALFAKKPIRLAGNLNPPWEMLR